MSLITPTTVAKKMKEDRGDLCVVRLKTSTWADKTGLHSRRDFIIQKRLSYGFNILEEDCMNIGGEEVFEKINNLYECEDGLYSVHPCDEYVDSQSGFVEDYDYTLVPFAPKVKKPKKKILP